MFTGLTRRFRRSTRLSGLLAAVVALVSQLALGAVTAPAETLPTQLAALDAAIVLCQPGHPPRGPDAPAHPHRAPDCALCPLGTALALQAVVLTPAPTLPAPVGGRILRTGALPPVRAPPGRAIETAYPRGPPHVLT
jgi:hypothetical protein